MSKGENLKATGINSKDWGLRNIRNTIKRQTQIKGSDRRCLIAKEFIQIQSGKYDLLHLDEEMSLRVKCSSFT